MPVALVDARLENTSLSLSTRFVQFGSIIDTTPRKSPVLYIPHHARKVNPSTRFRASLLQDLPPLIPVLESTFPRSTWHSTAVVRCKVSGGRLCAITVTLNRRFRALRSYFFIYGAWADQRGRENLGHTTTAARLVVPEPKPMDVRLPIPPLCARWEMFLVFRPRCSFPFSNADRDQSTRVTNSAEGIALIPGRRCTGRTIPLIMGTPMVNLSKGRRGIRCHPRRCRTILPIRPHPSRVSIKVVAEAESELAALVSSISVRSRSRYLGNLIWGTVKGIAKSIGGLVARNQQPQPSQQFQPPQQQFGAVSPPYQQQIQGSLSPNHSVISPPISPMTSGMGSPMMSTPTTSNQQYSDPPSPESSDEFDDFYDPNDDFQTNGHRPQLLGPPVPSQSSMLGQRPNAMNIAMGSSTNSINGNPPDYEPTYDPFADPNQVQAVSTNPFRGQGQNAGGSGPIQAQAHAQFTVQVTSPPAGAGGHGNGYWDPNDPNNFPSQQQLTSPSPGSSMTCRLSGCNKPVFVDPATYQPSEYCSQRHRE